MPLPWNPNSPTKIGLEHENVGYAAARIGSPTDMLALRFTALTADPVHAVWLNVDAGANVPSLELGNYATVSAGLAGPICVDLFRAGDEVMGDATITICQPTSLEITGAVVDETLSAPEIGDVQDVGDGLFLLSPNTVSKVAFGFDAVTGIGDTQQILDVRARFWNRKSCRIYRIDNRFGGGPGPGTYFFVDRADGTSFVRSDVIQGDGYVDSTTPLQWSRWTPTEVKEFRVAGKRRWQWRPLTYAQGRLDAIQLLVTHTLDRRIGHGIAEASDNPYEWFRVPIWPNANSSSGTGPTLEVGSSYVLLVRRMNPYAPVEAQAVTLPLRYIRHPDPPVNFELWTVRTAKFQSPGKTITVYKPAGLNAQIHGLPVMALEKAGGVMGDHTQPYSLARHVSVYSGRDALQYFTTPGSPGANHGMVHVTVSTANKPKADLRVQVELASTGAVVLGPTALSVSAADRAGALHDGSGEAGIPFRRAQIQFPATFTFAASTRYRIRFSSATTSACRWWIGALVFQTTLPPTNLAPQSFGGLADEGQAEIGIGGVTSTLGSDNLLSYHHSTVDDTSAMDSAPGWAEGTLTSIGRSSAPGLAVIQPPWALAITRLTSTADAQCWHHDGSVAYAAAPGQAFVAAASYRAKTTSRSVRVDLQWLDAANAVLSTTTGTTAADATGSWTQVSVTGTAPASTVRVRVRYTVLVPVANETHYVDQMGLWLGAVVPAWTAGARVRGELQAIVASLPAAPTNVAAAVKQFDISPPDCLGHNHLQTEISGSSYTDATTPDAAALDITGNLSLAWYGALDHYQGTDQFVGGKYVGPANRSYGLMFTADGFLAVVYSTDGTTERVLVSQEPHNFVDGQPWAVAVEVGVNLFGVAHVASFYISYDKGSTWIPLGPAQTATGTITVFSGTGIVSVGQAGDATRPAPGRHYWFRIYNGTLASGTQVANPDFTNKTVGQTALGADAAGRTWTADAGAIQAPDVNCCCEDPSRISDIPHVQLTWTATAHGALFARYLIQRNDDGYWRDVAWIYREGLTVWNDWSVRLGHQACYRIRAEQISGAVSAWTPSAGIGAVCVTVTKPPAGLYLTSDTMPTLNAAYVDIYDGDAERTWTFLEYGDVELHANHGVDKQVALHPIERRGTEFSREVVLAAICEDGRYGTTNPTGAPPLEITRVLLELTWAEMPYVVVRDETGHRWYANVQMPNASVSQPHNAWTAKLDVAEVAAVAEPVVFPA